ncbi:Galanin receptor type 1 [Chelonia mydas]|uniref:Galanin receptor type 1 n=1 Tax=Chelonia mydas TaxID=8469 RepID=M7BTV6_CHEMY|nr:Galanin receptor type 1 [Chelonia mydas]
MEPEAIAILFLNQSEPPWGEFNLSGLSEEEQDTKPLFGIGIENFLTLIVFGVIFALGVLGNSLVITVLARSKPGKPRSTTNIFILNLSIADLAYLLFCIPFQSTVYVLPTWVLGAFICKFIHYFFTVSMLVSIFTLSAMSVDRYVAIVHSRRASVLRVSRNALLGVGLIWALSIAMASPVAHHQRLFHRDASNQTFCWEQWPNPRHKKVYVVCTFVFGYLLPLLLISFCYAKISGSQLWSTACSGKAAGAPGWFVYLLRPQVRLIAASTGCTSPLQANGGCGKGGQHIPRPAPLSAAPIGLERRTVASGRGDRTNLRT